MSVIDSPRARRYVGGAWLVFAGVNTTLMFVLPGEETIPYHLTWASFAYLYGVMDWSRKITRPVFVAITVATGIPMISHATLGIIEWEECTEIVLMGVIAGLLVWHVDRHRSAQRRLAELRTAEAVRAGNRELATRFGSHELRTRLTIARGFIDMIRESTTDSQTCSDATVAVAELDKAVVLATDLMTLVRVGSTLSLAWVNLDECVRVIVRRWAARVDREWTADVSAGIVRANGERFEAAIDCLVENAVKFTTDGDRIGVRAYREGADVIVSVADSGAGIPVEDVDRVTELFHTSSNAGERAGYGLGLPIVRATVEARGGTMSVSSELGVGTTVTFRVPHGLPERSTSSPTAEAGLDADSGEALLQVSG